MCELEPEIATFTPKAGTEQSVWRDTQDFLEGGLAAERLNPPLFLHGRSGLLLRCRVQRYLRLGSLALRKNAFKVLGALSMLRQRWLSCRRWLGWLLIRHCLLVTRSSRAGAFGH